MINIREMQLMSQLGSSQKGHVDTENKDLGFVLAINTHESHILYNMLPLRILTEAVLREQTQQSRETLSMFLNQKDVI